MRLLFSHPVTPVLRFCFYVQRAGLYNMLWGLCMDIHSMWVCRRTVEHAQCQCAGDMTVEHALWSVDIHSMWVCRRTVEQAQCQCAADRAVEHAQCQCAGDRAVEHALWSVDIQVNVGVQEDCRTSSMSMCRGQDCRTCSGVCGHPDPCRCAGGL